MTGEAVGGLNRRKFTRFEDREDPGVRNMRTMGPMAGQTTADFEKQLAQTEARSRLSGPRGYDVGSLEDLKASAATPADLERISMDADGNYYRSQRQPGQELLNKVGMGHLAIQPTYHGRGPKEREERMGGLVKHGVELGDFWQDVKNLNRGRQATGLGQPHDPLAGFSQAAQQAAPYANDAVARTMGGNAQAMAGAQQQNENSTLLAGHGYDTEKANYQLGPDWQRSKALDAYKWGEPPSQALTRRSAGRGAMR